MIRFFLNANNRNFFRLWLAQLVSQFGDRIHQMALVGLMAQRFPGSAVELAKVMACTILPVFIIQPFVGVFVDRWDRKLTLFICDIARGLLVLLIPFVLMTRDAVWPLYVLVFIIFCFSRVYVPAKMSILPEIVSADHLLMANSLMTTTGMIAFALGSSLGGFLVEIWGPRNGFLWDAATFFLSASLVFSINMRLRFDRKRILDTGKEMVQTFRKSYFAEMKEGFLYIKNHPEIRFIINMLFILLTAAGAIYVVAIVFVQDAFGSITKDLGILAVVLGGGLFTGALLYGKFGKRVAWYSTIFGCLLAGGLMMVIFSYVVHIHADILATCLLAFVFGVIVGPIFIAANTVAMQVSDENMRGKVFSALEIVIHIAFLLSMLVSSVLADYVERVWILVGVGIFFSAVGGVGLFRSRGGRGLAFNGGKMA